MTPRSAVLPTLLLVLASGCATPHEEAPRSEPASEREYKDAGLEPAPEAAAPAEEDADPSLDELQRELAANNAKLRELGVVLSAEQQIPTPEPVETGVSTPKDSGGGGSKAGSSMTPPGGKPSSKPEKFDQSKPEKKQPRRDKDKSASGAKPQDDAQLDLDDDGSRPEPAKAAPPSLSNELNPEQRCQQVCDLAAISCGLGDQICELADRHPDELDYASACERANGDCDAAKEACDACVE